MDDFRNNSIDKTIRLLLKNNLNGKIINNFFKAFNCQNIKRLNDLKGIRQIDTITKILKFSPLEFYKAVKDKYNNEKFVFKTFDGYLIESVLMPNKNNISICVSVQIGCKFNCLFCNTGKMGFIRNLYTSEILDQIRIINILRILPCRLSCVSFMGMGEPFDNLKNCMNTIDWINSNYGYKIGREKITLSTSGCLSFKKFFSYNKLPNLAISIHFASDEKRKTFMPKAKLPLKKLKEFMIEYNRKTKKQISIEYCLLAGINDSNNDINELINYVKNIKAKINLLNYNKTKSCKLYPVTESKIKLIKNQIKKSGIPIIYRKSLGTKIKAGCGQLGESL